MRKTEEEILRETKAPVMKRKYLTDHRAINHYQLTSIGWVMILMNSKYTWGMFTVNKEMTGWHVERDGINVSDVPIYYIFELLSIVSKNYSND